MSVRLVVPNAYLPFRLERACVIFSLKIMRKSCFSFVDKSKSCFSYDLQETVYSMLLKKETNPNKVFCQQVEISYRQNKTHFYFVIALKSITKSWVTLPNLLTTFSC